MDSANLQRVKSKKDGLLTWNGFNGSLMGEGRRKIGGLGGGPKDGRLARCAEY